MATTWVYRNSDFHWMVRNAGDPALINTQPASYTPVTLAQDACPDPRLTRGQATAPFVRAATAPEIAAYDAAQKTSTFTATSRQKDVIATCAQIVRARGIAAWNAMTLQQKKDATLAEADVWVAIRQFIEDNL